MATTTSSIPGNSARTGTLSARATCEKSLKVLDDKLPSVLEKQSQKQETSEKSSEKLTKKQHQSLDNLSPEAKEKLEEIKNETEKTMKGSPDAASALAKTNQRKRTTGITI